MVARLEIAWANTNSSKKASERPSRRRAWRYQPSPKASSLGRWTRCSASQRRPRLSRSLLNPIHQRAEQAPPASIPVVVAEGVLVQVGLEPLVRDRVICATDATAQQRPKALDGVGMHIAIDV